MADLDQFEFAAETTREIIKYSAAILTLTVTFAKDTLLADRMYLPKTLGVGWLALILAVACGLWTLSGITGSVANDPSGHSIWDSNIAIPSGLMHICFMLGIALTAASGWRSIRRLVRQDNVASQ